MDDAFDQIEAFSEKIASQFQKKNIILFVAPEFERAYRKGKRAKGFYEVTTDSQLGTRIDFTGHIVKGVSSMIGTKDIWATMPENMIHLMKRNDNLTNIDMQKADRLVKILMDWWEAVGFGVNKLVWASAETCAEVATPVISNSGNDVTMSCATAGASIKYTTDGSTPTADSTAYSNTITITETTTFKARAFKSGNAPSVVAEKKVTKV